MKYFATRISDNLHATPEGYLLAIGVRIGRVGEMEYGRGETPLEVGSDGIVYVSRDAEELFKPETIASFEGKPFTIQHPDEFVNPDNWGSLAKGVIQNVRRGEGDTANDLICDILITDSEAISLVNSGTRQLSCGYEAEYIQTAPGKGIQKNIVGNHLALVEEGRAGDAYKINDEKGVTKVNKKLEAALKKLFGKTSDQILKEHDEKEKAEKEAAAKATKDKAAKAKKAKSNDSKAYDELVAMCKDLMSRVEKLGQPQDEEIEEEVESEDEEVETSLEDRLKKLEENVAKLLERESKEDEVPVSDEDEEEEVIVDEEHAEEKAEDEEGEYELTGDEKARVEILSPGMSPTKDFKSEALKAAYKTADGKKAIDTLAGGKPDFANAGAVEMMFVAASELLKSGRTKDLARTKTQDFSSSIFADEGVMTPEKMNEKMANHYNQKK